jgi:putative tricarboxylic transport membrane protein
VTRDGVLGLGLLVVAAAYYLAAQALPESQLADAVGAAGLPKAYAAVLAVLAIVLLAGSWRSRADAPAIPLGTLRRVGGVLMIGVAYLLIVPWVGYPLAVAGLIIGTTFYQGGRLDGRVATVGILGALVPWLVFVQLLGVSQPPGAWVERLMGPP